MAQGNSTNTSDLAHDLASSEAGKKLNLSVAAAQALILSFVDCIAQRVALHQTVRVHGLGNFKVLTTQARKGKNPKSGEPVDIPEGVRVHLAVSQHLKTSATDKKVPVRESAVRETDNTTPAVKPARAPRQKKTEAATTGAVAPTRRAGGFRPPVAQAAAAEAPVNPAETSATKGADDI